MSKLGLLLGLPGYGGGEAAVPEADVIRVRRTSDSTESDFNLTEWDDGTLDTFVGAGDGCLATWKDSSGNDNDVVQATTTLQPKVAISGVVQEGVVFDGTDDRMALPTRVTSGTMATLTAAAFIKTSSTSGQKYIVSEGGTTNNFAWVLAVNNGKLQAYVDAAGTANAATYKLYESTASVGDGNWHHVAFTFSSGTLLLYIDGSAASVTQVTNGTANTIFNTTAPLRVGASFLPGSFFPGSMSGIHVEQAALTAGNIATLAAGGEVGSPLIFLKGNYAP